nr:hypothetical protein GCM10020063_037730 [Dactylosporangium thailandense]
MTTVDTAIARFAGDVQVGDAIPPVEHRPTQVQLFRYCAVTWNAHRIHYDKDYAASEGYPDVLVQSHLHGAFLTSLCTGWMGEHGRLVRVQYSVRRFACPGDVLRCEGEVVRVEPADGGVVAHLSIREVRESDDVECARGEAEVFLPVGTGGS